MDYDEARADLDDFAQEMTVASHTWTYSQRLEKLRFLQILTKRALRAAVGTGNEAELRSGIETLLDRIRSTTAVAEQLQKLRDSYRS
ncbi:hypothetical protein [Stenotrophomonas humi]|uniref:hypothetical protein n=1 Tax=Stenotrophomonas humi TaxID=405444 RepID=UPI000AB7047C|nr:hypothetical protein [Stenotrophomonas humi]